MIQGLIIALVGSFFGSLGFGILLQAPRRSLLVASLIGSVCYGLYWMLVQLGAAELLAMFVGAALGALLAQYAARRMRMIATVFITIAIIPLGPGLPLCRCMTYIGQGESALGAQVGLDAMKDVLMIALGIGVGGALKFRRKKAKEKTL